MIKHAVIREGETPSEVSGKTSTCIKEGQALCDDEKPNEKRIEDVKITLDEHGE